MSRYGDIDPLIEASPAMLKTLIESVEKLQIVLDSLGVWGKGESYPAHVMEGELGAMHEVISKAQGRALAVRGTIMEGEE